MWWKIYFWLSLLLTVLGLFALLPHSPLGLVDILGLLLSFILLLSSYVYAFKKKVLKTKQWKVILWVVIFFFIEEMIELFVLPENFISEATPFFSSSVPMVAGDRLLSWFLSIPAIYATYRLSSK